MAAHHPKNVKITVCGEPGAGKSSLIYSLIGRTFDRSVPRVLHPVTHPSLSGTNVYLEIYDTASTSQSLRNNGHTTQLLKHANIVMVVCTPTATSLRRVLDQWLPRISAVAPGIQVVVIINKMDTVATAPTHDTTPGFNGHSSSQELVNSHGGMNGHTPDVYRSSSSHHSSSSSSSISNHYPPPPSQATSWKTDDYYRIKRDPRVVRLIKISVKNNAMAAHSSAFYAVEYVALHPILPLYNSAKEELTPALQRALTHIFRCYAHRNVGALCDDELMKFQSWCFGTELQPEQVAKIKEMLTTHNAAFLSEEGITLRGFFFLQQFFIKRNRMHTVWSALWRHGFQMNLQLEYARPREGHRFLATEHLQALVRVFELHADRHTRCLSQEAVMDIFSVLEHFPFELDDMNRVADFRLRYEPDGSLSEEAWLALWVMWCFHRPSHVVEALRYLGCVDAEPVLLKDDPQVVKCLMFGEIGVGKTTILKTLVCEDLEVEGIAPDGLKACAYVHQDHADGSVKVKKWTPGNGGHFFILDEVYGHGGEDLEGRVRESDIILLVYDRTSLKSLQFLDDLLRRNRFHGKPLALVNTKAEQQFHGFFSPKQEELHRRLLMNYGLNDEHFPFRLSLAEIMTYFQSLIDRVDAHRHRNAHGVGVGIGPFGRRRGVQGRHGGDADGGDGGDLLSSVVTVAGRLFVAAAAVGMVVAVYWLYREYAPKGAMSVSKTIKRSKKVSLGNYTFESNYSLEYTPNDNGVGGDSSESRGSDQRASSNNNDSSNGKSNSSNKIPAKGSKSLAKSLPSTVEGRSPPPIANGHEASASGASPHSPSASVSHHSANSLFSRVKSAFSSSASSPNILVTQTVTTINQPTISPPAMVTFSPSVASSTALSAPVTKNIGAPVSTSFHVYPPLLARVADFVSSVPVPSVSSSRVNPPPFATCRTVAHANRFPAPTSTTARCRKSLSSPHASHHVQLVVSTTSPTSSPTYITFTQPTPHRHACLCSARFHPLRLLASVLPSS